MCNVFVSLFNHCIPTFAPPVYSIGLNRSFWKRVVGYIRLLKRACGMKNDENYCLKSILRLKRRFTNERMHFFSIDFLYCIRANYEKFC